MMSLNPHSDAWTLTVLGKCFLLFELACLEDSLRAKESIPISLQTINFSSKCEKSRAL